MSRRCFIAGAGEYSGKYVPRDGDYVIAADAGLTHLGARGIAADLVVGDFDSLGVRPEHPNILQSPFEKDDTDLMLAVNEALSRGYDTLIIDGGLGGRLDQTLANLQILANIAGRSARAVLLGSGMCATAVKDGAVHFSLGCLAQQSGENIPETEGKRFVSVFCAGGSAFGVSLRGLKYPLSDAVLTHDYPLGVSNEFTKNTAEIAVKDGTLIVIWTGGMEILKGIM
ncbi:MAG: thiamine diphosphokinase [Oscillospiraceae bacterium]|nr:thiamine diphosphokinase [Oscillospiraceae bacterium]